MKGWSYQGGNLLDLAGLDLGRSLSVRWDPNSGLFPPEVVSDPPPRFDLSPWPACLWSSSGRPRSLVQDGAVERERERDKACSAGWGTWRPRSRSIVTGRWDGHSVFYLGIVRERTGKP